MYTLITNEGRCGGNVGVEPNHNNWTLTPYNGGLIKEYHDADSDTWIESATPEEIEALENQIAKDKVLEVYELVRNLKKSARERAFGKVGENLTNDDFDFLEKDYTNKYNISLQVINNESGISQRIYDLLNFEESQDWEGEKLTNEVNRLNDDLAYLEMPLIPSGLTRLLQYCYTIKVKFELGKYQDKVFTELISNFRSRMITFVEKRQYDKYDEGKLILAQINSSDELSDILILNEQFNAL